MALQLFSDAVLAVFVVGAESGLPGGADDAAAGPGAGRELPGHDAAVPRLPGKIIGFVTVFRSFTLQQGGPTELNSGN